jgi:hypothetical protein
MRFWLLQEFLERLENAFTSSPLMAFFARCSLYLQQWTFSVSSALNPTFCPQTVILLEPF